MQQRNGNTSIYGMPKSTQHEDALTWRLCATSSFRCSCRERVAHQEMCVHEIKAIGFDKTFFEPRHMFRECVSGSLHGWIKQEPSAIDKILDYNREPITYLTSTEHEEDDDMEQDNSTNNFEEPDAVPGHLRMLTSRISPMNQSEYSTRMQSFIARYSRLEESQKFAVEALLLELDKVFSSAQPP